MTADQYPLTHRNGEIVDARGDVIGYLEVENVLDEQYRRVQIRRYRAMTVDERRAAVALARRMVDLANLRQSAEDCPTWTVYDKADELIVELQPLDWGRTVRIQLCRLDMTADDPHRGRAGCAWVSVWGGAPRPADEARNYAAAILRACDEAERLQAEYRAQTGACPNCGGQDVDRTFQPARCRSCDPTRADAAQPAVKEA